MSVRVVSYSPIQQRVTCDLSSVGNQEGKNQMTQDTVKCQDRRLYTDISACYMISPWITERKGSDDTGHG